MEPIDVNIYILNLEEGKEPRIERMPGQIIEDELTGETPLIRHIGPNDFKVWYDDFEVEDLGFTHLPLPNLIELVVKRDTTDEDAVRTIANFCVSKLNKLQAEARLFKKGISVASRELATIYKEENPDGQTV